MWSRHCCKNLKRNWRRLRMKFQPTLSVLTLKMIKPNSILLAFTVRGEICPTHSTECKHKVGGCASITMIPIGKLSPPKYGGWNKHKIKLLKAQHWLGVAVLCTKFSAMTLQHSKRAIMVSLFSHLSKLCVEKHTSSKASTSFRSTKVSRRGSS